MSEIKALDKLREWSHHSDSEWLLDNGDYVHMLGISEPSGAVKNIGESLRELADEIQAEVDSRYMRLPVDAEGVPIRPGDEMVGDCPSGKHVSGTAWLIGDGCFFLRNVSFELHGSYMHHKPRTIEDVLRDAMQFGHDDNTVGERADAIVAKYADEIRELMKES